MNELTQGAMVTSNDQDSWGKTGPFQGIAPKSSLVPGTTVGTVCLDTLASVSLSLPPASSECPAGEAAAAREWTRGPQQPQAGCPPEGLAGQKWPPQEPCGLVSGLQPPGTLLLSGV